MNSIIKKLIPIVGSPWMVVLFGLFTVIVTMRMILGPTFFRPHDFTHAARLVEMQRSLQAGEFPVRWSRNFGFGYGMPLFNFYAPLPYYLGQLPLAFGSSPVNAIKFLYLINGILAFSGMYLFAAKLWGRWGGVMSATVFSFSTYKALDLFVRGALGEAFALALLPFALYGVGLALEKNKFGSLLVSGSLAAILLSHNLTGMVALSVVALYWLVQIFFLKKKEWSWQFCSLALSILLSIGLSAFYVLPAFFEKNLTRVEQTITVGNFDYHKHFLCFSQLLSGEWEYGGSFEGCGDDLSFAFGAFSLLIAVVAIVVIAANGSIKQKRMSLLLVFLLGATTFMTIGRSQFIWDQISLLKYFQFPWRFLTFSHVFLAALAGGAVLITKKRGMLGIVLVMMLLGLVISQASFYVPEKSLSSNEWNEFYNTNPEWIRREMSKTLNDYLPPNIVDSALPVPVDARFALESGTLEIVKDDPVNAVARISCPEDCRLTINNFQFPGWQISVDGKASELEPQTEGLPIYSLFLSAGSHEVQIDFKGTRTQMFGNILSVGSIISFIAVWMMGKSEKLIKSNPDS